MDLQTLKKINWKQPKYMLPLIIYVPLLFVGYFVIDQGRNSRLQHGYDGVPEPRPP